MDTNPPVGSTTVSNGTILPPVSWEALRDDPVARLQLLKEVRNAAGAKKMIQILYDRLRVLASTPPKEQEALQEDLADVLAALGIELVVGGISAALPVPDSPTPPEIVTPPADQNQGYSGARPTPDFPIPVSTPIVQTPAPPAPSVSVPDASAPPASVPEPASEKTEESLPDIKKGIEDIKARVGMQRFMEALQGRTPEDQEYVSALKAIGDPDTAELAELRARYTRFKNAAEELSVVPTEVPPRVEAAPGLPEVSPAPSEPSPAAVSSWGSNPAIPVPVSTPVSEQSVATPPPVDTYSEPALPVPASAEPIAPVPGTDPYREPVTTPETQVPDVSPEPTPEFSPEPAPETSVAAPGSAVQAEKGIPDQTVPEENIPAAAQEDSSTGLMTPEVTEGLKQLLSRWNIFEKSGWFGFGAHGIDHPLYKKLADLPVSAVASGRWEGADPAVTENIREYIQGWKQERGVEADPNEAFDTYLRRVIAEIIRATSEAAPHAATA